MNWIQGFLYGIISGLCEIIPVSSTGHQILLCSIFGKERDPILNALVHISLIFAIYLACNNSLNFHLPFSGSRRRRRKTTPETKYINTAAVVFSVFAALFTYLSRSGVSLITVSVLFLINGIVLFLSGRLLQGNRDVYGLSTLDSALTGLFGALSVFPGFSRTGLMLSYNVARCADRQKALDWILRISVPALTVLTVLDIITAFVAVPALTVSVFFGYLCSIIGAFLGGYAGVLVMRFLAVRTGFSGFAYYVWGVALFSFILYLI